MCINTYIWGFPGGSEVKVSAWNREDPLEKEMVTHSSTLAWRIPWREEPGRLQSMGSQRVRHDWATSLHFTCICIYVYHPFKYYTCIHRYSFIVWLTDWPATKACVCVNPDKLRPAVASFSRGLWSLIRKCKLVDDIKDFKSGSWCLSSFSFPFSSVFSLYVCMSLFP